MKYRNVRFLFIACFVSLSFLNVTAQIQHKQLRKDILEERREVRPSSDQGKKTMPVRKDARGKKLDPPLPVAPIRTPFDQKTAKIIYLENADLISFDQLLKPDVQILNGNVRFRHDDAVMTCDSAYFYRNSNSMDAFSNVKIVQGDTLFVYGDKLYYDGNLKLVRLRGNARLVNRNTTLTTDSLNYDRTTQLAYYFTGGKIVDPENTLTSVWGQYSTRTEDALFSDKVKLVNENFVMNADTLTYNTKSHIANLVGETHIVYQDKTDIYTNKGWYNTQSERSMLLNRSSLINKEGKSITGDTIFYDKAVKYGEVFGQAILKDTVQKSTLYGNYVYYNEDKELGVATDSALLVDWSNEKHLYVHADTLMTFKDSVYNEAKAWRNVRFFREDIQGLADSLVYSSRDSIMHLMNKPVIWQESQQYSSEKISILSKNQEVYQVELQQSAMVTELMDSLYFNQISGKDIIAHLDSSQIRRVDVNGNAETIYFIREESDSTLIGANRTESSFVVIHFKDKKIDRIVLTPSSSGEFHPMNKLTDEFIYLTNFFWLETHRPLTKEEVFLRFPDEERPKFSFRNREEPGAPPNKKSEDKEVGSSSAP
ncbi:MAG: OstA-like protein [Paludibacter sp.]|nr:OstA-like protein [Paludibacter sp.]MDD4198079.1 OstA-like protein [Paludibacter sp.]MDD4427661.1 OstA-like protein [Paludibacter sp.]